VHRPKTDPEDFRREEWATSAYPVLYRRAWNLTRNTMAAQDLTQQAMLRVLKRWPVADGPTKYAMRCLTNDFIDSYRRHRRHPEEPRAELPDEASREDVAGSVVDHVVLTQALARLTPRQHVIVDYYLAGGMPFAEIADLLGLNESSVYRDYRRALDIMRAYLREPSEAAAKPRRYREPTTERGTSEAEATPRRYREPTTERGTSEAEAKPRRYREPTTELAPAGTADAKPNGHGGQSTGRAPASAAEASVGWYGHPHKERVS
jgi:RNA polymerase sigma factor (sigma-70 family)